MAAPYCHRPSRSPGQSAQETITPDTASKGIGAIYGKTNQRGGRGSLSAVRNAGGPHYRAVREFADYLSAVRRLRPDVGGAERRAGLGGISSEPNTNRQTPAPLKRPPAFLRTAFIIAGT